MHSDRSEILMPRESGRFISELASNVFIVEDGIKNLTYEVVENMKNGKLSITNFSQSEYHPDPDNPKAADWIFVVDTLNFCFWNDGSNAKKYRVQGETGYFALCAAIKRAVQAGIPITESTYLSTITRDELRDVLRGDEGSGEIPLIDERVKNLNDVGRVLLEKYKGTFLECINSSNNSSEQLLKLIVRDFECYRDESNYHGQRVSFYKRAQILVGDIWSCFQGKGIGAFHDIEYITMFPDYRVPQVLVHFKAMRYTESLYNKLSSGVLLESGCDEEIEIRGCSIEVIERVVREVRCMIDKDQFSSLKKSDCNSILVDQFLWEYRRRHVEELDHIPYHKVRTIFY